MSDGLPIRDKNIIPYSRGNVKLAGGIGETAPLRPKQGTFLLAPLYVKCTFFIVYVHFVYNDKRIEIFKLVVIVNVCCKCGN